MYRLEPILESWFKTDIRMDDIIFWVSIIIGILMSSLIWILGCQAESGLNWLSSKLFKKKKRRK